MGHLRSFLEKTTSELSTTKKNETIIAVLGNESCDLDSAISAIIYGYFLYLKENLTDSPSFVIPFLNIDEKDFALRTETIYFLEKFQINTQQIPCRYKKGNFDYLKNLLRENTLHLVLVDHHILSSYDKELENNIIEIIDHRPINTDLKKKCDVYIELVGSCATLIADKIFKSKLNVLDEVTANLLYGTIILDTINFDPVAKRFLNLDIEIANKLQTTFNITVPRDQLFDELRTARSDISTLTPFQILHRDMKIINGIPFPGVPMLVVDFLKLCGSRISLSRFCISKNCEVTVIMGLDTKNNKVFRDIGVFALKKCELQRGLINKLKNTPDLQLLEIKTDIQELVLFSQNNVKMSRKQIVPILKPVIETITAGISL